MMRPSSALPSRLGLGALAVFAAALAASPALAVGTRTFELESLADLKGGDLTGVSIDSNGNVTAGYNLGSTPITDATSVWSSVVLPDGSVLLGTGNEGKIFRVTGTQVTLAATTGQMAVSSLAVAWNGDVIVGTFPDGKLFRLPGGANTAKPAAGGAAKPAPGGAAKPAPGGAISATTASGSGVSKEGDAPIFATLPDTEDIWGLAYDAKAKVLYAATGPEGKLYRIDAAGKAQVYFDSDEPHLTSVAVAEDGTVYTGSNGKGLLYKLTGPGRASVLYDFDADDVKAIAIAPAAQGGSIYAIANKYTESFAAPKRNKAAPTGPQPSRPSRPGKGTLMRFAKDGVAEELLDNDDTHYVSLALGEDGAPYVGTGAEGQLYTVDANHVSRLVADTDERQVGAVVLAGKTRFIATTDPAVYHEVKGAGGADAVWTSKVLDAGLRATFGQLAWRSEGPIEFSTRSGNTAVPDATWSGWSGALAAPGDVQSPPARYVQMRARWSRDPKALLREVKLSFVTDNARAVVTSIDAVPKGQTKSPVKTGIVPSGGEAPKPATALRVTWKVDNADQDELRYRLSYKLEGQTVWRSALKPGEKLTQTSYDWETTGLPEGVYRLLVEASDELSNPPDRVLSHRLESGTVLVDNTPPVFKALGMQGRQLTGEVVDGVGPIARIEVSVAGTDEWRPIFPTDNIFDEPAEPFKANIAAVVPAGNALVVVRAYDSAGNFVTKNVEAR